MAQLLEVAVKFIEYLCGPAPNIIIPSSSRSLVIGVRQTKYRYYVGAMLFSFYENTWTYIFEDILPLALIYYRYITQCYYRSHLINLYVHHVGKTEVRVSHWVMMLADAVLGIGNLGFCLGPRAFRGLAQTYACRYNRNYSRKEKNFNFRILKKRSIIKLT
jgi:hypothetical protein